MGLGRVSISLVLGATLVMGCMQTRAFLLEKQARYLRRHPELDASVRNAILHLGVVVGMNKEQVKASLEGPIYRT